MLKRNGLVHRSCSGDPSCQQLQLRSRLRTVDEKPKELVRILLLEAGELRRPLCNLTVRALGVKLSMAAHSPGNKYPSDTSSAAS